ncbi:MAG TPA: hypothetical protein IAC62_15365 [Candidatus Pelethocola excrementipullorum]|nr:hypothetical protein [Candidatus Pelethocola excrementipullorum]
MKRNKLKKVFSGIMTAALALTLCMGTAVPVSAGSGTENSPAEATITKKFQFAQGVSTPAATFTFAFTKVTEDGATPSTSMPAITDKSVTYTAGEAGTTTSGLTTVTKETGNILAGLNWTHAGEYVYSIAENATGYTPGTGEAMVYSQATYKLYVRVANGTSGLYVANVMAESLTNDDGSTSSTGKVDPAPGSGSGNGLVFTNTYTKQGGSAAGADSLVISNAVSGTYADQTKQFNFSLTVTNAPTSTATSFSGTITHADLTTSPVTVTPGTAQTFTLAHGEKLTFANLPAGTTYNLSQTGATGYKPSYSVVENGGTPSSASATNFGDGLATGNKLVGENANSVAFTNTYNDSSVTPTGILINNLPFILLIGVALLALGAVVVSKKRQIQD